MARNVLSKNKDSLEGWINTPVVLEALGEKINGTIKHGVRLPIRSGMTPLAECELGSVKKIEGEKPNYWFVNGDQSIKVRLLPPISVNEEGAIYGSGVDVTIFKYVIRRQNGMVL